MNLIRLTMSSALALLVDMRVSLPQIKLNGRCSGAGEAH